MSPPQSRPRKRVDLHMVSSRDGKTWTILALFDGRVLRDSVPAEDLPGVVAELTEALSYASAAELDALRAGGAR